MGWLTWFKSLQTSLPQNKLKNKMYIWKSHSSVKAVLQMLSIPLCALPLWCAYGHKNMVWPLMPKDNPVCPWPDKTCHCHNAVWFYPFSQSIQSRMSMMYIYGPLLFFQPCKPMKDIWGDIQIVYSIDFSSFLLLSALLAWQFHN